MRKVTCFRETNKTRHPAAIQFLTWERPRPRESAEAELSLTRSQSPVKKQAANLRQDKSPLRITRGQTFPLGDLRRQELCETELNIQIGRREAA